MTDRISRLILLVVSVGLVVLESQVAEAQSACDVTVSNAEVTVGESIAITGFDFDGGIPANLYVGTTVVHQANTDGSGVISTSYSFTAAGSYLVQAIGFGLDNAVCVSPQRPVTVSVPAPSGTSPVAPTTSPAPGQLDENLLQSQCEIIAWRNPKSDGGAPVTWPVPDGVDPGVFATYVAEKTHNWNFIIIFGKGFAPGAAVVWIVDQEPFELDAAKGHPLNPIIVDSEGNFDYPIGGHPDGLMGPQSRFFSVQAVTRSCTASTTYSELEPDSSPQVVESGGQGPDASSPPSSDQVEASEEPGPDASDPSASSPSPGSEGLSTTEVVLVAFLVAAAVIGGVVGGSVLLRRKTRSG